MDPDSRAVAVKSRIFVLPQPCFETTGFLAVDLFFAQILDFPDVFGVFESGEVIVGNEIDGVVV